MKKVYKIAQDAGLNPDQFCRIRNGCFSDDEDFDGQSYRNDWPGTDRNVARDRALHPSPVMFTSPVANGRTDYSTIAFETDLPRIEAPALILCGQHDELTPACSMRMKHALRNAELHVFPNSSHMPFYEEPAAYYPVLTGFLKRYRG